MSRPDQWNEIEDCLLLDGFKNHLGSPEIAAILKRQGYGVRSADAIRRRYQRLRPGFGWELHVICGVGDINDRTKAGEGCAAETT